MPSDLGRYDLSKVRIASSEGHLVDATFSQPSGRLCGIRRAESRVVGRAGPGDGAGREGSVARAGRRAVDRAERQGRQPRVEALLAGGGHGRRRRQHRGHGLLRHGGMGTVFAAAYAPSTLGSFLRSFTFGHVRQADAVASRFLINLAEHTELLGSPEATGPVLVDLDDTIIEVHGYAKQGAAFGYSGVRGLNAVLATVSTETVAR